MPIQLDKILSDIAHESVLHPNYLGATKKEVDDAWARVGKNSSLSVHESRSIFKVLQKKYEQEKIKDTSAWKLFGLMDQIHKKSEAKPETKEDEPNVPMEEDEEYEMLEVQEEEDGGAGHAGQSGESGSEGESPNKSHNSAASSEKEEKQSAKVMARPQTTPGENTNTAKLLNSMAGTPKSSSTATAPQTPSATAAALQKKGITMKKTGGSPANQQGRSIINQNMKQNQVRTAANAGAMHGLEVGKTIQLPESLKRKLSQDQPTTPQTKKMNQQHTPQSTTRPSPSSASNKSSSPHANQQQQQHTTTAQLLQLKQDCQEQQQQHISNANNTSSTPPGINLITIPANPSNNLVNGIINTTTVGGTSSSTAATVASTTSTNGFSPRIEDIDFRNDIIFDTNNTTNGGTHHTGKVANSSEIINLGNLDNSLPPTFFKNLCNSSRHEALGLYVANVMNRLRPRSAAKLEVGILRAILDIQSDELDQ